MEGGGEDSDLTENSEFFNLASMMLLQDDVNLENENLIQNPNTSFLIPDTNQNQGQQQALSLPFENMHINPNHDNLNQTMTNHSQFSSTLSFSQPRPNLNSGHLMANHYFPITPARPNISPDHLISNLALAFNTRSIPQARPNPNPGHLMANHALPSNTLSIPLAGVSFIPRVGTNMSPRQILVTPTARALVPAAPSAPAASVSPVTSVFVPGHTASQIRSQDVSHQEEPATPSGPASSPAFVIVSSHTASTSQIGNHDTFTTVEVRVQLPANLSRRQLRGVLCPLLRPMAPVLQHDHITINSPEGARGLTNERRQMDRHLDMRLDTDHMSHEELLELQVRIGDVNTGVSEEIINKHMIQRTFSALSENGSEKCCICQEEFVEGEQVVILVCKHIFHTECIKKWLFENNKCPLCNRTGIGPKKNNIG